MKSNYIIIATVILSFHLSSNEVSAQTYNDEKAISSSSIKQALKVRDIKSSSSIEWQQFGPGMSGNNKIAFWHPTDVNTLYISPNMGNSYRSTDKGLTYETVLDADGADIKSGLRGPKAFNDIDFSRQNPNFGICVDDYINGIFFTYDKGKTWKLTNTKGDALKGHYLSSIAVDQKNDKIWYLGSGKIKNMGRILFSKKDPHGSYIDKKSLGLLWKSTDAGKSWSLMNKGINPKAEIESILVDPKNSNIIYASTTYGFYISKDGAKTWTQSNKGLDTDVLRSFTYHYDMKKDILTFYTIANPMWSAKGNSVVDSVGGIFRSIDRGKTWIKVNGNLPLNLKILGKDKDVKKSYYNVIAYYFGLSNKEAMDKFPILPEAIMSDYNQITVDPTNAENIYLINNYSNSSRNNFLPGQMWRSKDGGKSWYVTFRMGKNWKSGKDIAYWKQRNNPLGINVTLRYLKAWTGRDPYERKSCNFAKFNANGTVLHTQMAKISLMSYDKGDTWVDIDDEYVVKGTENYVGAGNSNLPGHGFYQDIRYPGKVFCFGGENSLWTTNEGGDAVRKGAQAATSHKFFDTEQSLSSYAIDPKNKNIHYALFFRQDAKGKLLRSTDEGKTWSVYGSAIPDWKTKAHSGDQSIHQIHLTIDPNNSDNLYFCVPKKAREKAFVGDSQNNFGFHLSRDGGKTWKSSNTGLPKPYDVIGFKLDPNNSNIIYACVQNKNGGLFKSTDKGETWNEVASTENISKEWGINDINFAKDGKIYITAGAKQAEENDGGLWVSDNNMKSWKKIFDYPNPFRVETALYNPNIIMLSTLPANSIDSMNSGIYISKDAGKSWIKANKGNGQSDRINDIAIDYTKPGKYYLSTYGSGWYVANEK